MSHRYLENTLQQPKLQAHTHTPHADSHCQGTSTHKVTPTHGFVELCSSCGPNLVFTSMEFKKRDPDCKLGFMGADCLGCSQLG